MDVFSEIIVNAVDKAKNAVVKIDKYALLNGKERLTGSGSGFVFSSDGLILTNAHVLENADRLNVSLLDGNEFSGELVGTDKDTDVAIIKVFGTGYTPVKLGNSGELKIGQLVIAIGNPLGYQHSVSVGVLSGVGRTMRTPGGQMIDDILQSDAAMNPGNSGGPMIDTNGEVIGINTAIIQSAQGLSFSIGIDSAKEIARYLISDGKVIKAFLGLMTHEIEIHPRIKNFYRLSSKKGLMITGLENSSPASRADLHEGDIIIEFDGGSITNSVDLTKHLIGSKLILKSTAMKILRQTKIVDIDILPVERPAA
ncbi:MAG TPA: trypsin-like peptidase domain-containing protein [Bacteroidales bacterium]